MTAVLRTLPGRITAHVVAWSVRHAWATLLVAMLVTTAAAFYTARHLAIDTDTSNMLDPNLPHRQAHRGYRAAFPDLPGDVVVFAEAAHPSRAEDAADALAAALAARGDIARSIERPGQDAFFRTHGLLYLGIDELWALDERLQAAEPLLGTLAHDPTLRGLFETLAQGLEGTLDDPQRDLLKRMFDRVGDALARHLDGRDDPIRWRDELLREDGDAPAVARAFVLVDPALAARDFQPAAPAVAALRTLLAELAPSYPDVRFRLTGSEVMDNEELVTVAEDAKVTTALSFVLVACVLVAGLRSATLVGGVLLTLACGLVWTAAFATWAVGALNIISVCFAVLFIGMGVDFGIQFTMRYLEESDGGSPREPALVDAARGAGGALALAAVGAAICFFAFVPTPYRGLAQLGVISGFSMFIAWFANLTVLPAALSRLPVPRRRAVRAVRTSRLQRWVTRHARAILAGTVLLVAAGAALAPAARFDLNPLNLKDGETEGVAAFRALAGDPDSSPYTIQVLAPSLADADALAARIAALPEVARAVTLSTYVPDAQEEKIEVVEGLRFALAGALEPSAPGDVSAADEAASVRSFAATLAALPPDSGDAGFTASRARLQGLLDALLAHGEDLESRVPRLRAQLIGDLDVTLARLSDLLDAAPVTLDGLPESLRRQYIAEDGQARIQVVPRADLNDNDAMRAFVRAVQRIAPAATDAPVELYEGSRAVIRASVTASVWALLLTLVLHLGVLRGVLDALLIAAPLVLAALLTVATSVLCDVPFNFANIIALPLLIGLNNAYGAYLVVRRHGADGVGAMLASSTPRAILFSGMTTIASFGVLGVSQHPGMAGMGILISVSLCYAIASALIVLPALMVVLEQRAAGESA
ncbi:MAG: MMPL family transporter [Gammaproteobacteria bacterium]